MSTQYIMFEVPDYVAANKYNEPVCTVFETAGELLLYLREFLTDNLPNKDYSYYNLTPNLMPLTVENAIDVAVDLGKNRPLDWRISHIVEITGSVKAVHDWLFYSFTSYTGGLYASQ